jgi:hypothetical protein
MVWLGIGTGGESSCERGNEPSGPMKCLKCWGIIEQSAPSSFCLHNSVSPLLFPSLSTRFLPFKHVSALRPVNCLPATRTAVGDFGPEGNQTVVT